MKCKKKGLNFEDLESVISSFYLLQLKILKDWIFFWGHTVYTYYVNTINKLKKITKQTGWFELKYTIPIIPVSVLKNIAKKITFNFLTVSLYYTHKITFFLMFET